MPQKIHYIPWEQVTANTLRNVCRDLGLVGHSHSRDEMRTVLQDVESRGLEAVLKEKEAQAKEKQAAGSSKPKAAPRPSARPRKAPAPKNEDVHDDGSGTLSPRRSGREPRLSEKRKASLITSSPARPAPASRRRRSGARTQTSNVANKKAAFNGVVLSGRRRSRASVVKAQEVVEEGEGDVAGARPKFAQLDAEGDENMEVDAEAT